MTEQEIRNFYNITSDDYMSEHHGHYLYGHDIKEFLASLPAGNANIMDLGCAHGLVTEYFEPTGYMGFDLSDNLLKEARNQHPKRVFVQGNAVRMPFSQFSFKGVFASVSLCHLSQEDFILALREIHRILVTDGVVMLAMPYRDKEQVCKWFSPYKDHSPYTVTMYPTEGMKAKLYDCGLEPFRVNQHPAEQVCVLFGRKV